MVNRRAVWAACHAEPPRKAPGDFRVQTLVHCTCPLSGVKRTWPIAEFRFRGRYWVPSGHRPVRQSLTAAPQSG